jgi:hypothetical protein
VDIAGVVMMKPVHDEGRRVPVYVGGGGGREGGGREGGLPDNDHPLSLADVRPSVTEPF